MSIINSNNFNALCDSDDESDNITKLKSVSLNTEENKIVIEKPLCEQNIIHLERTFNKKYKNKILRDASKFFITLVLRGAKENLYTKYYQCVDIVNHIPEKSLGYFHKVVNHHDKTNSVKLTLYDWNYNGKHVYIYSCTPWLKLENRNKSELVQKHNLYNKITNDNISFSSTDENENIGHLSEEGFNELKIMSMCDIFDELSKVQFFTNYNTVKELIKEHAHDRIQFLKKNSKNTSNIKKCHELSVEKME